MPTFGSDLSVLGFLPQGSDCGKGDCRTSDPGRVYRARASSKANGLGAGGWREVRLELQRGQVKASVRQGLGGPWREARLGCSESVVGLGGRVGGVLLGMWVQL